jgi:uncharacterized protein YdeI (YjbR/CyaY-like superfamily)
MGKRDKRVDEYIAKSQDFAKPILNHLRELAHKACPDVEETMKWSFPHFDYKGIMASMAGFKQHCVFGFWKASLMKDPEKIIAPTGDTSMGQFGKIKSMNDLPPDKVLLAYIKEAAKLNADGIKVAKKPVAKEKKELVVPDYLAAALKKNKAAQKTFENFPPSKKKDYVEWVTEAKTEVTREKRLATAIEWMAEGKSRNWKYEKC